MAQAEKATYYQALKRSGYEFAQPYRNYTTAELKEAWEAFAAATGTAPELEIPPSPAILPQPGTRPDGGEELRQQVAQLAQTVTSLAEVVLAQQARPAPAAAAPAPAPVPDAAPTPDWGPAPKAVPAPQLNPNEHAGVTQNTHTEDEVLETDEHGNQWYQREVPKAGYAKPRGRRVLRTYDSAVRTETIQNGEYTETFEVSGDVRNSEATEIKITLPSYQTGIYRAPNMPFRIHTYNGVRGFSMTDVDKYYGGADLVPATVKRMYVSTDLCYDIQTVIRAIETEYRDRVLKTGN